MGHSDISAFCAIAAAATTAACSLHGEVVCPDKDRSGEMDGVVSFCCHTEPYFFMLDEEDDPWRVEFADARNAPALFPGCRVKVRGIFQQLLAGCMFRLGAAMGKVGKDDAGAAKQLELLRDSLNHTQASLRAALWGLTEEAEGPAALTELFKYAASRMPQWEGIVHFTIRGRERDAGEVLQPFPRGRFVRHVFCRREVGFARRRVCRA